MNSVRFYHLYHLNLFKIIKILILNFTHTLVQKGVKAEHMIPSFPVRYIFVIIIITFVFSFKLIIFYMYINNYFSFKKN
jgi:hypothetical protein